jgi:ribosomal protein S18 acetylase RimI-like enzyme
MDVRIRPFRSADAPALVEILRANGQYGHPRVEGPEAMARAAACEAAVFLVAEAPEGSPAGLVRGVYDGSRAMIYLLSVAGRAQGLGVGRALAHAAVAELARRGAPTVSVTVTDQSADWWKGLGFEPLPVYLMLRESTDFP